MILWDLRLTLCRLLNAVGLNQPRDHIWDDLSDTGEAVVDASEFMMSRFRAMWYLLVM